jgi:predicted ATP-grasp superfamily ATP-dependent carboligase
VTRSVLIAGLSTRAAADSAVAAGFNVTGVDAFGDLDVHPSVRVISLPRDVGTPFTAEAAARAAAGIASEAAVYLANFENEPDAVSALASGRTLWGNPPDVLRRVRDPVALAAALRERGLVGPRVRTNENDPNGPNDPNDPNDPNEWLLKPRASGGGRGIRAWDGRPVPDGWYLQERITGVPGSIAFVAANGVAIPLGLSLQLAGETAFGADGYRYCGNILAPAGDPAIAQDEALLPRACAVASAVTASFDLVGVNGVDFIAAGGEPYPLEVNPRWTGAMELIERSYGLSVFGAHANACARGELPVFDLVRSRQRRRAIGKAILFARETVTMGDADGWLADRTIRDVPRPGERIAAGRPICTIFADGDDAASCHAALVGRAERLYSRLESASGRWLDRGRSW